MLISFVLKEKNDGIPLKLGFWEDGGVKKGREASVLIINTPSLIIKFSKKKLGKDCTGNFGNSP